MNKFSQVDETIDYGFPRLTIKEIEENITLGTYQLYQSNGLLTFLKSIEINKIH